jgi:hypothetical protein
MDKLSRLFMEQVQNLQKQIADLLEREPLQKESKPNKFIASNDLSQIENIRISLPMDLSSKVETLFFRLSPYFEAGLLFLRERTSKNQDGSSETLDQWHAIAGFDRGELCSLRNVDLQIPFRFPPLTLVEVQRVHSKSLFDQLQQIQVAKTSSSQVLIFRPHPDYIFLVSSELPDPWLKPHIEKVQKELLLILCDEVDT